MIQELLGSGSGTATTAGGRLLGSGDRKISASPSPSNNSTATATTTTIAAATTLTQNLSENNNQSQLRCPRCDSSNTKFCYYNNYNLTQPRHFCKTCRRYWTKGGALRNVPIGGGCRKNHKSSNGCIGVIASPLGKPSTGKLKNVISSPDIIGKSPSFLTGYDYELLSSNPNILWASPQSSHHLLALLAKTQNPNPNPNNTMLNSVNHVKEEGFFLGSQMMMSPDQPNGNGVLNARHGGLALDPSIGLCNNTFWRNNNQIHGDQHQNQLQQNSYANHSILGELQNKGGILDHQKLSLMRSSTTLPNYNYSDHNSSPVVLAGNVMSCGSSSSNSSGILDSAPVGAGGGGGEQLAGHHHHNNNYWNINPSLSWSDLPTTTNGAYP